MPREREIVWVDAFTTTPFAGNACAVVLDARGLDDATMQALARETNLSETSYVFPGESEADFVVRYWTPAGEIPLAGHPTIATVHALRERGAIAPGRDVVRLRMPAALVPVTIRPGAVTTYTMSQPEPSFLATVSRARAASALGIAEDELLAGCEPQTVSTGTPQLMIALASPDVLDRVEPDRTALFRDEPRDWFSVHVFARAGEELQAEGVALVARHFAGFGDVKEDPFTGSATGGMAAYCARYGVVPGRAYDVVQGMHVHRPGRAHVEVGGEPPGRIGRIAVGGPAVTVMRATIAL
ncbi:MAG TPA: PhzF family phenazine biosynthesis protein [Candidatus Elarobacter sp.]|jgi:trans-2,3-dihydro-3-hydroxyanthranilate isomerase|nr:PhzF family phenazine biosynthesis protein [Candidatus Elarobacter sp.]